MSTIKITLNHLNEIGACSSALCMFYNTPKLNGIEFIPQQKKIILSDYILLNHLIWYIRKTKNAINITEIYYTKSEYFEHYFFNELGYPILIKKSNGTKIEYSYENNYSIVIINNSMLNIVKKYMYDDNGNLIEYQNDIVTKHYYDDNNNKILTEKSNGYWKKYTYDNNNNLILINDSTGYFEKRIYNKYNKIECFETSNNYWMKYFYDDKGNLIKTIDSYDFCVERTYDDNNQLISINNSSYVYSYQLDQFQINYLYNY